MKKFSNSAYLFTLVCIFISYSSSSKAADGTINNAGRSPYILPGSGLNDASKKVSLTNTGKDKLRNAHVLVYTKNGKGYVHDNIASAVAAITALGLTNKF